MTHTLNCRELRCPMPIVELARAIQELKAGDRIVVEATDPAFEMDVRAWAEMTGNDLESFESGDVQRASILVT